MRLIVPSSAPGLSSGAGPAGLRPLAKQKPRTNGALSRYKRSALCGHGISLSRRGLPRCFGLPLGLLRLLLRLGNLPLLLGQLHSARLPCPIAVFVAHGSLLSIHR